MDRGGPISAHVGLIEIRPLPAAIVQEDVAPVLPALRIGMAGPGAVRVLVGLVEVDPVDTAVVADDALPVFSALRIRVV
jgi:hypothetical protein